MAPEVIHRKEYEKSIDFWALGVTIYKMMTGHTPFVSNELQELFNMIKDEAVKFPASFSREAVSLITG